MYEFMQKFHPVCVHLQTQQFCIYIVVLRTRLDCISPKSSLSWVRTHITHTYNTYIHTRIRSKREKKGKGSEWLHPGEEEEKNRLNKWGGRRRKRKGRDADDASVSLWIPVFGSDRSVPYTRTPNIFILFYSFLLAPLRYGRKGGEDRKGKDDAGSVAPPSPLGDTADKSIGGRRAFLNSAGDWGRAPPFFFCFLTLGSKKVGKRLFFIQAKRGFSHGGNHALIIALTQWTPGTLFSWVYPDQKQQRLKEKK